MVVCYLHDVRSILQLRSLAKVRGLTALSCALSAGTWDGLYGMEVSLRDWLISRTPCTTTSACMSSFTATLCLYLQHGGSSCLCCLDCLPRHWLMKQHLLSFAGSWAQHASCCLQLRSFTVGLSAGSLNVPSELSEL